MTPHPVGDALPLAVTTPVGWIVAALSDLDALLADHAHCELKAASTAMSMAGRFGEHTDLVQDLTVLAHEEIRHFERVLDLIRSRGRTLPRVAPDPYVRRLKAVVNRGFAHVPPVLDPLILCAFIEARSCERFRILAAAPLPAGLSSFYRELAAAEERHHELFLNHARKIAGVEMTDARVREVAAAEAEIVLSLPLVPRIH